MAEKTASTSNRNPLLALAKVHERRAGMSSGSEKLHHRVTASKLKAIADQ